MKAKCGLSFKDWGIRAMLNVVPDTWPPEAIDASRPIKWQTRRVMKEQPPEGWGGTSNLYALAQHAPYRPGEVYYAREALQRLAPPFANAAPIAIYRADEHVVYQRAGNAKMVMPWRWKRDSLPAIFMPREAARLFYVVKRIRVERVQDIREADCYAEGCPPHDGSLHVLDPGEWFRSVFEHINGEEVAAANPWAGVYDFMRTERCAEETIQAK